ncbi:MAG: hypothetical protein SGPRY_006700, partial [Prymnesium sp.]
DELSLSLEERAALCAEGWSYEELALLAEDACASHLASLDSFSLVAAADPSLCQLAREDQLAREATAKALAASDRVEEEDWRVMASSGLEEGWREAQRARLEEMLAEAEARALREVEAAGEEEWEEPLVEGAEGAEEAMPAGEESWKPPRARDALSHPICQKRAVLS